MVKRYSISETCKGNETCRERLIAMNQYDAVVDGDFVFIDTAKPATKKAGCKDCGSVNKAALPQRKPCNCGKRRQELLAAQRAK